ncbi:hypothetical protein RR48_11143 [Papilio machaon]|uniref:Uncharacterized protein n=1 Tax=Papilio machaon TaxID=76193 RepID=A0A194RTS3_PAPMA|nr:hypothetical protein RR48_11143 [Papilio machaon]
MRYIQYNKQYNKRVLTAFTIAFGTANDFYAMFQQCVETFMPNEHFIMDNLFGYVNYPMKTTVGSSPDFTSNRKFFANLISTPAFKEMLAKDTREIRMSYYLKMKYCDVAVLDQQILRDFYDHEVDQTKVRK